MILRGAGGGAAGDRLVTLSAGDRLAMLIERIDELSLQQPRLRRQRERPARRLRAQDRPAESGADRRRGLCARGPPRSSGPGGAAASSGSSPRSTARTSGCCATRGRGDAGDLVCDGLRLVREQPGASRRFEHVLIDDAQELDLAPASLARAVGGDRLTAAGDPGAGAAALPWRRRARRSSAFKTPARACRYPELFAALPRARRAGGLRGAAGVDPCDSAGADGEVVVLAVRERARPGAVGGGRHRAIDRA